MRITGRGYPVTHSTIWKVLSGRQLAQWETTRYIAIELDCSEEIILQLWQAAINAKGMPSKIDKEAKLGEVLNAASSQLEVADTQTLGPAGRPSIVVWTPFNCPSVQVRDILSVRPPAAILATQEEVTPAPDAELRSAEPSISAAAGEYLSDRQRTVAEILGELSGNLNIETESSSRQRPVGEILAELSDRTNEEPTEWFPRQRTVAELLAEHGKPVHPRRRRQAEEVETVQLATTTERLLDGGQRRSEARRSILWSDPTARPADDQTVPLDAVPLSSGPNPDRGLPDAASPTGAALPPGYGPPPAVPVPKAAAQLSPGYGPPPADGGSLSSRRMGESLIGDLRAPSNDELARRVIANLQVPLSGDQPPPRRRRRWGRRLREAWGAEPATVLLPPLGHIEDQPSTAVTPRPYVNPPSTPIFEDLIRASRESSEETNDSASK